ncbi:MAG TPA: YsnF/AvaK domain-containing protein [Microvirga sp.]|jgi:uncharacterized protein (TIGR02271 family)|nr:YsnF/AvaK domain-containing protein [Microvirga sp.]
MKQVETEERIPLVEEEVRIDKRTVERGRVRVRTVTDEVEEMARATLDGETVEVDRVPVDRMVEVAPEIRTEGDVTIIPVVEEVLVVEKRLVLKEELHVRRRRTTEEVEVPVTVRRQRAVVEREGEQDGDSVEPS